jgi:hypothetical protein
MDFTTCMGRKWRTRIYVSSFDLLFVLSLIGFTPFGNEARKLGRHILFFMMDLCNRLSGDTSITKRLIPQLRVCNLEAIYLVHICIILGTFRWLDFLVDGQHILYMALRGVSSFLIFTSLLLCIIRLLCSLIFSLTLLRYRVSLHERYQDVCFCIVFGLIMYSFHATGVLPTTRRPVQLSVPLSRLLYGKRTT